MPGALYDYVVSVILLSTLFVVAVVAVPSIGYVGMFYVDEQQLRNVASEALKTMLLDSGYPADWGLVENFDSDSLDRFGLASSGSSALFELDSDKVQRLVVGNSMGYLEYEDARELLGLQGYGFGIKIAAPFNVTVTLMGEVNLTSWERYPTFEVVVTYGDEKPVPNANVKASILYSYLEKKDPQDEFYNKYSLQYVTAQNVTDALGRCNIYGHITDPLGKVQDNIVAVFQVTVANVATVVTEYRIGGPIQGIAEVNMIGDTLVLSRPEIYDPNSNNWITSISIITEGGPVSLYNGTHDDMLNYGSKDLWEKTFAELKGMEPQVLIFNFNTVVKQSGREGVLVAGPSPAYLGNRVVWFGGTPKGTTVTFHRTVQIGGMTYIVEFVLWKEFQV